MLTLKIYNKTHTKIRIQVFTVAIREQYRLGVQGKEEKKERGKEREKGKKMVEYTDTRMQV